jgi:phytoene dehydrogenase-like protein
MRRPVPNLSTDIAIVGAGHNGLVAATFLARHGLKVIVVEEKSTVGGAAKTEFPFAKAPRLGTSTGAYLLGVMQPELIQKLGVKFRLIRRDPHYFLPTLDNRYLLFGSDQTAMRQQFLEFFSEQDWLANGEMNREIGEIRDDLAPAWLAEPQSVEATAERYIRPELRRIFLELVARPVEEYLARFDFKSELLLAMYAVTDGFSGLTASFGTNGTGMNFLVHNMCRLPGSDGTWMIVQGGMGNVTKELARLATEAGAQILTSAPVQSINIPSQRVASITLKDGREISAKVVLSNADPFRTRSLVGTNQFPADLRMSVSASLRIFPRSSGTSTPRPIPRFRMTAAGTTRHSSFNGFPMNCPGAKNGRMKSRVTSITC